MTVISNRLVRGPHLLKRFAGKALIITSLSLTFTTIIRFRVSLEKCGVNIAALW